MRNIKHTLFVIMTCFCGLVLLISILLWDSPDRTRGSLEIVRQYNDTFTYSFLRNDVLLVEGEGTLHCYDIEKLNETYDVDLDSVENIIVGDGVEEIDHDCFSGLSKLKSIKLGNNLRIIRHGALCSCSDLDYVLIPDTLEKVSDDFLDSCGSVSIITANTDLDMIPKAIGKGRVYTGISDFESFEEKVGRNGKIYERFLAYDLGVTDLNSLGSSLRLHNGVTQFGPYTELDEGAYVIRVIGCGFDKMEPQSIYVNVNGEDNSDKMSNLQISDYRISYDISFDEDVTDVEFCMRDTLTENDLVEIEELDIYSRGDADNSAQELWW